MYIRIVNEGWELFTTNLDGRFSKSVRILTLRSNAFLAEIDDHLQQGSTEHMVGWLTAVILNQCTALDEFNLCI